MITPRRRPSLALAFSRLRRARIGRATLGAVAEHRAETSAALLLLLAGCFALVPIPGLPIGIIFGSLAMCVAVPLMFGYRRIALPRRLAERPLPPALVARVVRYALPPLRWIERRTRPRLVGFARGIGARFAYATATLSAALVTMPVPFGNTLPALAIVLVALGLNRQDGVTTIAGHVTAALGVAWNVFLVAGGIALVRHVA